MGTVIEIPEELKSLHAPITAMVHAVLGAMYRAASLDATDYAATERLFASRAAEIEREAHRLALSALDVDRPLIRVGDVPYRRDHREPRTYYTLVGPVVVHRTVYRPAGNAKGTAVDPVALRTQAVDGGWLPATAQAMAFLLQQGTAREAATTGQQLLRLPYSHDTFATVGHRVAAQFEAHRDAVECRLITEMSLPEAASSVSVSLDRVSVPMEEPKARPPGRPRKGSPKRSVQRVYRMAYCATVTLHDAKGKGLLTIRYGRMPKGQIKKLVEGLCDDVVRLRERRPTLKVILLCDGAHELWNLLDAEFTAAVLGTEIHRLVDLWHFVEKLGKALRVRFARQPRRAAQELAAWKLRLLNREGAAEPLRRAVERWGLREAEGETERPVHELLTYLENQRDRLHYAKARALGLPIGSGNVEATCKSLFEVRMKRPGARWHDDTGAHVVELRALALSDRWDRAMALAREYSAVSITWAA